MLIHPIQFPLKSKTLVEDLISYSGSPTEANLSPYQGMAPVLRDQTKVNGDTVDLKSLTEYIRKNYGDYDSIKQKPVAGPYCKREPGEPVKEEDVLIRLEDIDYTWVEKFVTNAIIGYKINRSGRSVELANMRAAPTFTDSDGDILTEAYITEDTDNTSGYNLFEDKAKLPYLLKRLHYKSILLGTSLISIYGVYLRFKSSNIRPAPRDIPAVFSRL